MATHPFNTLLNFHYINNNILKNNPNTIAIIPSSNYLFITCPNIYVLMIDKGMN